MVESADKTVYFFGAGASHASDFGLPTMKNFFRMDDFESGNYDNLKEFIEHKFPETRFDELNLETVITFLELSMDTFGSLGRHPDTYLYEARREFDKYVDLRLRIPENIGCQEHKKIIGGEIVGSNSKDSIITLNYDLVVDNTMYILFSKQSRSNHRPFDCFGDSSYRLLSTTRS